MKFMDTQDTNMNSICPNCSAPMIDGACPVCSAGSDSEAGVNENPTPASEMPEAPQE